MHFSMPTALPHPITRRSAMQAMAAGITLACTQNVPVPTVAGQATTGGSQEAGFALVELFTSEGCSSCPPADDVLMDLQTRAAAENLPIVCVGFHVDYWDRLGWIDPLSHERFTTRQRQYQVWLQGQSVYTPQIVVNGLAAMVGSRREQVAAAVASALQAPAPWKLEAKLAQSTAATGEAQMTVTVPMPAETDLPAGKLALLAAVCEDGRSSQVTRGENSGRTLKHAAAARNIAGRSLNLQAATELQLAVPADLVRNKSRVAVWVQDFQTGAVLAARNLPLPS